MIIDGRCEELRFSSWTKSHWDNERYMLLESRFNKRGDKLMVGEWKKLLEQHMIMHRGDHYHTRIGGILEDFEGTIRVLTDRLCTRLKLGSSNRGVEIEDLTLIDLTPRDSMDALLVAEAIMEARSPPSLLNVKEHGTKQKLRGAIRKIKGREDMEEEDEGLNLGFSEIKEVCNKQGNGLVVIRRGVMERVGKKTEKTDVILDEDLDHYYLNGVGVAERDRVMVRNKKAFWNCNGWGGILMEGRRKH